MENIDGTDKPFDHFLNNLMVKQFGKRRGKLYRSERDWYICAANDPQKTMKNAAAQVDDRRQGLYDEKGFSRKREHRWMGSIPFEMAMCNPELMHDAGAVRRFFEEFPVFSSKGK